MLPLTLSPDRKMFLEGGTPWVQRGTLDWVAYGVYLNHGEAAARVLIRDRKSVGANTMALAGELSWWPNLTAQNPAWWPGLRPFADLAAEEGMRLQWVVLCDTAMFHVTLVSQIAHWQRFVTTLGDKTNCTFVLANQPGHGSQAIQPDDVLAFPHPRSFGFPALLCARENPLEEGQVTRPAWDFCCFCNRRDWPKGLVRAGSSLWYVAHGDDATDRGTRVPTLLFEPPHIRDGEVWANPGIWRQFGRSLAFEYTCGGNIYADQMAHGQLLTGVQRDCAVEMLGNVPMP